MRNKFFAKTLAGLMMALLLGLTIASPVMAGEGHSATASLAVSRSTVNIGKTFTLTLQITPNANVSINNFQATIQYDSTRFSVVMVDGSNAKVSWPSGVPPKFLLSASVVGNLITVLGNNDDLNSPIPANGKATSLITLTLKVKDTASTGTASFSISECNVDELVSYVPTTISLTLVTPKTVTVAPRLDTDAYLSELTTDTGTLAPAFSKTVTQYTLDVPTDCTAVAITAKQESSLAKVAVTGGSDLAYGENKVTVKVSAQDYDVSKIYTVTVNRAFPVESSSEESSVSESIASSEESSSIESIEDSSASSQSSSSTAGPTETSLNFWKMVAYLFIGLFIVTAGALVWFVEDKAGKHVKREKPVRIKRIK